jgi:hypothetical protein
MADAAITDTGVKSDNEALILGIITKTNNDP